MPNQSPLALVAGNRSRCVGTFPATKPSAHALPVGAVVTCFCALACIAHAQTITPTNRIGTLSATCGPLGSGPSITYHYSTPVDTHDPISVSDSGGGYFPISSAANTYDAVATPTSLSLSMVGASMRGSIPPGGTGSAYASASGSDQWSFSVSQTTCFTLDAAVNVFVSTGALTGPQGFQLGIDTFGGFTLADGSHPGILAANLNATGSVTQHYSGTIAAGNYFMTISGQADGNGAPRSSSYNTFVTLTIGAPAAPGTPASATACVGQSAPFSIPPVPGATYQWQIQTGPNTWQSMGNDPGPLPCGGGAFAYAAPINSPSVTIGVHPCPGVKEYTVRCLVSNTCGSTPSNPATLYLSPADVGSQGGVPGADGIYDNNDFVVFINAFFNASPAADLGRQGGVLGADGSFDNNDFVVFIDQFFAGC